VLRPVHVGLAPGEGPAAEGGGPHLGDGLEHGTPADYIGHRLVETGSGETWQVLHVGVAAHEHAVAPLCPKLPRHGHSQSLPEGLAGVGVPHPVVERGAEVLGRPGLLG